MGSSTLPFQPSCPSGGTWYACGNATNFVGCCTTYPCTNSGCLHRNLRPASFLTSAYGKFPDQECSAGAWYSCKGTKPTFFGCCASNACGQNGCPTSDLRAGILSKNVDVAQKYNPQPPLSNTTTSSTSITSVSASPTSTDKNALVPGSHAQSPAVIAGAVAGGVITFLILAVILGTLVRAHQRKQQAQTPKTHIDKETISPPTQAKRATQPNETTEVPLFISESVAAVPTIPAVSNLSTVSPEPRITQNIHEAGSREVSYTPYSPNQMSRYSSGWRTGTMSQGYSVSGSGANSMNGLASAVYIRPEYAPAELR